MFCIGFLSGSALSIESFIWSIAVPTWPCTCLHNRSLSVSGPGVADHFVLLRGGFWSCDPVCPYTAAMQNRAFSVAGPRVWNDLPQKLRLFPRLCTDTFLDHLKIYILSALGFGALLSSFYLGVGYFTIRM